MKIFIVGGTSGIGLAIAIKYLDAGHEVGICGRDLKKVALVRTYSSLKMYQLDVYNKLALEEAVNDFAQEQLDIMIISVGSYANDALQKVTYEESTDMLRVNIAGAVNGLEVARMAMKQQGRGQVAVLASVSGLLSYRGMTTYSMTKRALIQIADAYRKALTNFGITVTVVAPGYVNSPKLQKINNGDLSKKMFVVSCEYAAEKIIEGLEKKKDLIVFPPKMKHTIQFLSYFPSWFIRIIMYKKAKWSEKK